MQETVAPPARGSADAKREAQLPASDLRERTLCYSLPPRMDFILTHEEVWAHLDGTGRPVRRQSLTLSDMTVSLTSVRVPIDRRVSGRRFVCEANCGGQLVFHGAGFSLRRLAAGLEESELYAAADGLGAVEADTMAALLDHFELGRLFRPAAQVMSVWEADSPERAAAVLDGLGRLLRQKSFALNASPLEVPPRPDAPGAEHIDHRQKLETRLNLTMALQTAAQCEILVYTIPYHKTGEEQLEALRHRAGLTSGRRR